MDLGEAAWSLLEGRSLVLMIVSFNQLYPDYG